MGGEGVGDGAKPRNIKKRPVPWLGILLPKSATKAFHFVPLANPLCRKKVSMRKTLLSF